MAINKKQRQTRRSSLNTYGPVIRLSSITDGTSNTRLMSEYTNGRVSSSGSIFWYNALELPPWSYGSPYELQFDSMFPPNAVGTQLDPSGGCADFYTNIASSLHPGGVNVSFCDGSVRFIKSSISSWSVNNGYCTCNPAYYTYGPYNASLGGATETT